ncbi:DDE_4 domain-containing protein, partial [Cephalotus follicularis]
NFIGPKDGVHAPVCISLKDQIPYIGRKGIPTQNVMAACNFDMQFIFAWAGWEGSTHDTRTFYAALRRTQIKFPHHPTGNLLIYESQISTQLNLKKKKKCIFFCK